MTCALKTQRRSRAICKDKVPEAALARSLSFETICGPQTAAVGHCWVGPVALLQGPAVFPTSHHLTPQLLVLYMFFFQSILPSLELRTRTVSPPSKEDPPAQQLLGASSSALCLPMASLPGGLPALSQPPPCTGFLPYYRTEAGICTGSLQRKASFTRIEGLETKEGGQRGGSSIWNLRGSCLVS